MTLFYESYQWLEAAPGAHVDILDGPRTAGIAILARHLLPPLGDCSLESIETAR